MADNECCFVGQNHARILRVLCGTLHGNVGRRVFVRKFFRLFWIESVQWYVNDRNTVQRRNTLFKPVFILELNYEFSRGRVGKIELGVEGYTFMSRNKQPRKYLIGRSYIRTTNLIGRLIWWS